MKELLDVGLIHSYKGPYGALVFLQMKPYDIADMC